MSEAFARIKVAFDAFQKRVKSFEDSENVPTTFQDACECAYEGLYKLKERIDRELEKSTDKCNLTKEEKRFCIDLFSDKFLSGLLQLRVVATHVVNDRAIKEQSFTLLSPDGFPMDLDYSASANAVFSSNIYSPYGVGEINHRQNLREAVKRIAHKIRKFESNNRGA